MSAYTTIRVTRGRAKELWAARLMTVSDAELERFMDGLLEPRLYNVWIVGDHEENQDYLAYGLED